MAMTGTVKFFNGERGYGFIKPDDGGRDVFVHITAVERAGLKDLTEGQRITFEVEPDKKGKGPKAVNLVISAYFGARAHLKKIPAALRPGGCDRYFLVAVIGS
jgi:CspA family cold shock protein